MCKYKVENNSQKGRSSLSALALIRDFHILRLFAKPWPACHVMQSMLLDILKNHWLFSALTDEKLSACVAAVHMQTYEAGQYVFHQMDDPQKLYIIIRGEVSIETHSLAGKVIKIKHLIDGDIFGEFALIDDGPRSANAVVMKPTEVAALNRSVFQNIMKSDIEFSQRLLRVLVNRLRHSNHQVESLVSQSLSQRTARLLCLLQAQKGDVIKVTQKQLSDRLFASREKVNEKLQVFEARGAILKTRGRVEIVNLDTLKKLSDIDG